MKGGLFREDRKVSKDVDDLHQAQWLAGKLVLKDSESSTYIHSSEGCPFGE